MSFFDIINTDPQKIVDWLNDLGIQASKESVVITTNILAAIIVIGFVLGVIYQIINKADALLTLISKKRRWRKNIIKTSLEHSFGDYLLPEKQKTYIKTKSQGTPPHNYDEPDEAVTGSPQEDLISMFVDRIFKATNTNRNLYIIFAGSGMGKTTFAVHLFVSYINNYKESNLPYEIHIFNMADANIIDDISDLSRRIGAKAHNSILILDALDENIQAAEDFEKFRVQLESVIEPYKFVVITCRSQFFPDDQSVPDNSNIKCNTADKNLLRYNKIYICPFSADDIELYVKRKYKRKKRKKVISIIQRCSHLMVRPVLLSHLDDLLDENELFQDEASIYKVLIEKWIQREINHVADLNVREKHKNELYRFSRLFAISIYTNWKETGMYRMSKAQLDDFCEKNHFDSTQIKFRQRSLINHDSSGAYKFSHKSFMEFFLAQELFNNPSFNMGFEGMDMAQLFYAGLCKQEFRQLQQQGILGVRALLNDKVPNSNITLFIRKESDYIYRKLLYVIGNDQLSEISIDWRAYNDRLQEYINLSKVNTISISHYHKGEGGLRSILGSPYVIYISIQGDDLPNNFLKEASKRPMVVIFNGNKVVDNLRDYSSASLNIQLMLRKDLQNMIDDNTRRLYDRERMIAEIIRMNKLLNEDLRR